MNMFTHVRMPRDSFEQGRREILRVWGCEAHTLDTRHIGDRCEQPRKVPVAIAVRIDILPEEGHLFESLRGDLFSFSNDPFRISRSFPSSGVGYNAKTTEVVASSHDGNPGIHSPVPFGRDIVIGFIF